jgi:hypothetical protein
MFFCACSGNQKSNTTDTGVPSDTIGNQTDSIVSGEPLAVMPYGADELFDDFFFNYASSRRQQLERTVFPLPFIDINKPREIQKKEWKMEPFFINEDCYTLIFDSQEQMELVRDTNVVRVVVERFDISKEIVEQFVFSRQSGRWMLHEKRNQPLAHNPNAQFLKFYEHFATDSVFQRQSLAEQIVFSGPDPDDDFSMLDGMITPDFWDAFRPDLPHNRLYNIVYGHQNPASIQKILLLRGISNGMEVDITFRLKKGRWKLTKLVT